MKKKNIGFSILMISFACLIVFAAGLYMAINVTMTVNPQSSAKAPISKTTVKTPKQSSETAHSLQMLILGDSIAKGTGDEKGKGFTGDLPDFFKNDTSKELHVTDAGIDGLESLGLLEQIQSKRLNKPISESNLILISIGGNDLKSILSLNALAKEDAFKTRQDSYLNNLKQTLNALRTLNPNTTIIFLGLYNPFEKLTSSEDTSLLNEWNYNSQQLIESDGKAIFIPTYDLFKYNLGRYIAKDGLHPNSAGYQAISNRISQSVGTLITGS